MKRTLAAALLTAALAAAAAVPAAAAERTVPVQVDGAELARAYPRLAASLKDDVQTSIRIADLPDWVRLAARMKDGHVNTGTLVAAGQAAHPDYAKARTLAQWLVGGHT